MRCGQAAISLAIMVGATLAAIATPAPAQSPSIDLHALWHERCTDCHGHAAAFARKVLDPESPAPSVQFLERHRGGLPPDIAAAISAMLASTAATPPRFETECRVCHGLAAPFVRSALIGRNGALVGRYSGRDVDDFLAAGHARLDAPGAAFFSALLRRIAGEVRFTPKKD